MLNILNDYQTEFLNQNFKKDLELFLNLSVHDVNTLVQYLMEINEDMNSEETLKLIKKLESELKTKCSQEQIVGMLRLLHLFTHILVKVTNIDINDIIDNLVKLEVIQKSQSKILEQYLEIINENITYEVKRILLANTGNLFFPRLIEIKCAAAIKAITDNDEIKSYLPVASVYISVKDDAREKIYFQATARDIQVIIEKLNKIQRTLKLLDEKSRNL